MPSDRRLRLFGSTSKRTSHAAQLLWHHRNPDPYRSVPERWREKERAERKGSVSFSFRSIKAHRASRSSKRSESEASLFFLLLSFFPLLLRLPSSLKATRRWPPPRAAATLCRCHSRQPWKPSRRPQLEATARTQKRKPPEEEASASTSCRRTPPAASCLTTWWVGGGR